MKSVKIMALLLATVALAACDDDKSEVSEETQAQLEQAAQIGQAQAIAQIIERAMTEPCQPINLFNNIDENNKKEVNLINIACESLDIPQIPEPEESNEDLDTETEEANTENTETETAE